MFFHHSRLTRRTVLKLFPAVLASLFVGKGYSHLPANSSGKRVNAQPLPLTATPACFSDIESSPVGERAHLCVSPERSSLLEPGITGQRLILSGQVLTTGRKPIGNALVDFWQADRNGNYDKSGHRLQGHQFTDMDGRYRLETILPQGYDHRARHLHVQIQVPERPFWVTQLFFPDDPLNRGDRWFQPALTLSYTSQELARETKLADGMQVVRATFDFILDS